MEKVKRNIIFEGASGIGKTTLTKEFKHIYDIIPEVNKLFERTDYSDEPWYLNKQIERFRLGNASKKTTIFDGDLFQPIWYNWIFNKEKENSALIDTLSFYEEEIRTQDILFPDLYILFFCSQQDLRKRIETDTKRQRRNFEKHLLYIKPQISYFKYLQKCSNINVKFIEYSDLASTIKKVDLVIKELEIKEVNDFKEFQKIKDWINDTNIKSLC